MSYDRKFTFRLHFFNEEHTDQPMRVGSRRPLAFLRKFMPTESHQHGMEDVIKNSGAKNLSQLLRAVELHEDRTRAPAIVNADQLPDYYHSYRYIRYISCARSR